MFTKGQTSELAWVTSSNIPTPLYLFSKILPLVYQTVPLLSILGMTVFNSIEKMVLDNTLKLRKL